MNQLKKKKKKNKKTKIIIITRSDGWYDCFRKNMISIMFFISNSLVLFYVIILSSNYQTKTNNDTNHLNLETISRDNSTNDNTTSSSSSSYMKTKIKTKHQQQHQLKKTKKFITYKLIKNNSFSNKYNPHYKCLSDRHLDPVIKPLLDFTVSITTNLKVLFLGDSVGIMLSQMFEELTTMMNTEQQNFVSSSTTPPQLFVDYTNDTRRTVLQYGFRYEIKLFDGIYVNSPVNGGGLVAGWRITGLMIPSGATDKQFQNKRGGKWKGSDITYLLNHTYDIDIGTDELNNDNNNNNIYAATNTTSKRKRKVDGFDSIILRIPHGWMYIQEITKEKLIESIHTAAMNFGSNKTAVSTFIIITLPIINNIETHNDLNLTRRANHMIHELSNTYNKNTNTTMIGSVKAILVLDFANLIDDITQFHGRRLGYNETEIMTDTYLFDKRCRVDKFYRSIPLVCSNRNGTVYNSISFDGIHWCNEYLNGRIGAGIACLLQCATTTNTTTATAPDDNDNDNDDNNNIDHNDNDPEQLNNCARECNERFMTLNSSSLIHDLLLLE